MKDDEEGKLEALPSISLLLRDVVIKMGERDASPSYLVSPSGGKLEALPFLFFITNLHPCTTKLQSEGEE